MKSAILDRKTQYKTVWEDVQQLKAKMKILGSLKRFEDLATRGRAFAKKRKIKQADVLKND